MKIRFASALLATAMVAATTSFASAAPPPIKILQCFVTSKALSKKAGGTQIVYVNEGMHILGSVTFAVGYRNSDGKFLRKVTDVGSFAPGAKVDHHFALYSDVTYGGKSVTSCTAIAAH